MREILPKAVIALLICPQPAFPPCIQGPMPLVSLGPLARQRVEKRLHFIDYPALESFQVHVEDSG
jgi:hypothetical protein